MTRRTNWSTHATFGGTPMVSRGSGKRIAATDHCVAIVRICPTCLEKFVSTPVQPLHGCCCAVCGATARYQCGNCGQHLCSTCDNQHTDCVYEGDAMGSR